MKILHARSNIGSQTYTFVKAFRALGHEARGLVYGCEKMFTHDGLEVFETYGLRSNPVLGVWKFVRWLTALKRAIDWADVVHWRWGWTSMPKPYYPLDLKYIRHKDKVRIVEFCGTDIRRPQVAALDNTFAAGAYARGTMKRQLHTGVNQELFGKLGFACVIRKHELRQHVREELFHRFKLIRHPIWVEDFAPKFLRADETNPVIVHCPSHRGTKGTEDVLRAVDRLRNQFKFSFRLISGVPRAMVIEEMGNSDIVLDQFVLGDYGNVTLEAMALGKPVLCYLKPYVLNNEPPDLPIVNATPETLEAELAVLLASPSLRAEIGRRSRLYVEKHHDAKSVARDLFEFYEHLLREKQGLGKL